MRTGEKLKTTLTHATLNDIVLGIAFWNWCVGAARASRLRLAFSLSRPAC